VSSRPAARDADGNSVDASMRIDGLSIVIDVNHRDADARYPKSIR
jgi:hypothetical protein